MLTDAFTPNAFRMQTLTASIERAVYAPGRLQEVGLFTASGITTLDAAIEYRNGVLSLVDVKPRGAPGKSILAEKRDIHSFRVPHIPVSGAVLADEVQGVRAFGSETQAEVLQTRINNELEIMRRDLDYTIESHRVSALKGLMYNANGGTTDLFTEFGVTQATQAMALTTATTKVRVKITQALKKMEDALDGTRYSGARAFCGQLFWEELIDHPLVRDTYQNTQMAASLRANGLQEFDFGGVTWERYRGTSTVKIEDDDAYLVPVGVPDLFITRFAPANYNETVNTVGRPYYVKAEPMKFGKGYELEGQSNPLNICTRPGAIVKLTKV
jgi:hypothetical protein